MKNVEFKRIEIQNFLSIGKEPVCIDFKKGLSVITGVNHDKEDSKNGVGKSTIADALFFCLFGTTIRELKKDDIINNITQKNCKVKLYFDVTENKIKKEYELVRKISPNKVLLKIDGEDFTNSSMPKTTEEVSNIIGASADVFRNAVIMTVNGTVPFMAQKKVEKRKFCEGLFGLDIFQDMLLKGRKKYNEVKGSIAVEEGKYEEVGNTLDIYKSQQLKKEEYRISRTQKLLSRHEDNTKELDELEGTLVEIDNGSINEYKKNIKLLEARAKEIQKDTRAIISEIATKEEQVKNKEQSVKELKSFGDMCNKCKRPFTENDIKARDEKIAAIKIEVSNIKTEIKEQREKQKELDKTKEKCSKAIDIQKQNINDVNNSVENNKNVEARIKQLKTWNDQIWIDIQALEQEKEEFEVLVGDTEKRLAALKRSLENLKKKLHVLDSVKYIVSEEGVKSFIIKKLLKLLNGKLSYYLNKLDAPCRFKFNEYFDEQIINDKGQECSYHNFSSGERKRVDLAILFTFMDIRRLQGNTATNLAFYDEILDTSLDNKGIESFLEILKERVEKYNEACYIISHKTSAIKTATHDVVFLEKKNGFTTLGEYEEI